MSNIEESVAVKIHNTALKEGEKYAKEHGQSPMEEVAYGRGYKSGYMKGSVDMAKEMIDKAIKILREKAEDHIWYSEIDRDCGLDDEFYDEFKKAMEE